ncbi:hypothetical protein CLV79_10229 [Limimaricola soesokkakensis]|uniref:Type I restriction enzyme S subunit n=2 Tax=Limimaricola soesokkakensis TaxID=1343159 RepID=A0A1X6YU20_9RHOB|nr:hypothetical protein CLV79_10229 [Limimaricola soesokkakensis]SLN30991.1 hypothetical protein LOS8367_01113 [Limimaricola soesokkakensis]
MLAEISRFRAKISSAISLKKDQIAALKEYKTSLINAAVTGKIQVTSDSLHETGQDMDACSELKLNEYA